MWEGGRKSREQIGSIHVFIRGNNRRNVFYDDYDRIEFLKRCNFYGSKYNSIIQEFVLMDNHVHLQTQTDQLSNFISALLVSFIHYYKKKYNTVGNLFQSPFGSVCKHTDAWKIDSMLYILQNPLSAKICQYPAEFKWSSFNLHFNGKSPLKKYISIDSSLVDSCYRSKKKLEDAVAERKIRNMEIDEYHHMHFDKLSNEDLCAVIDKMTNGKNIFSLTNREIDNLIKCLYKETNASMFQIASLTHENYDYVRKLCRITKSDCISIEK